MIAGAYHFELLLVLGELGVPVCLLLGGHLVDGHGGLGVVVEGGVEVIRRGGRSTASSSAELTLLVAGGLGAAAAHGGQAEISRGLFFVTTTILYNMNQRAISKYLQVLYNLGSRRM